MSLSNLTGLCLKFLNLSFLFYSCLCHSCSDGCCHCCCHCCCYHQHHHHHYYQTRSLHSALFRIHTNRVNIQHKKKLQNPDIKAAVAIEGSLQPLCVPYPALPPAPAPAPCPGIRHTGPTALHPAASSAIYCTLLLCNGLDSTVLYSSVVDCALLHVLYQKALYPTVKCLMLTQLHGPTVPPFWSANLGGSRWVG